MTALRSALFLLFALLCSSGMAGPHLIMGEAWKMHVIDDDGRGSDGTKLSDINRDGLPDITTAWEEDGSARVYLNPGRANAHARWPRLVSMT